MLPRAADPDREVAGTAISHLSSRLPLHRATGQVNHIRTYYVRLDDGAQERFRFGIDYAERKLKLPQPFTDAILNGSEFKPASVKTE